MRLWLNISVITWNEPFRAALRSDAGLNDVHRLSTKMLLFMKNRLGKGIDHFFIMARNANLWRWRDSRGARCARREQGVVSRGSEKGRIIWARRQPLSSAAILITAEPLTARMLWPWYRGEASGRPI